MTTRPITTTAAASVDATRLENMVFAEYLACGLRGATQDELLEAFPDFSYSSITARPSALKRKGLVIVDLVGPDDDAQLPARLHGKTLFDPGE